MAADEDDLVEEHLEASQFCFVNVKDEAIASTQAAYESLALFKDNEDQRALWKLLTIGRTHNCPDLLELLVSDFSRARIKHFVNHKAMLSAEEWSKHSLTVQQIATSKLNSGAHDIQPLIKSAIDVFQKRLCRPVTFDLLDEERIGDSLLVFARRICEVIAMVQSDNWPAPSQLDVWIIPEPSENDHSEAKDDSDDNADGIDDGFDESDSDSDSDDDIEEEKHLDDDEDDEDEEQRFDAKRIGEHIKLCDADFAQSSNLLKRSFLGKADDGNIRGRRLCLVIRHSTDQKGKEDNEEKKEKETQNGNGNAKKKKQSAQGHDCFLFYPSEKSVLPRADSNVSSGIWGIDASLSDILPRIGSFAKISGNLSLQNRMFLLSLQKKQKDEIRAWLFHRSSMCRFYPSDLMHLFPRLFAKNKLNALNEEQEQYLRDLIANHPLPDTKFDVFARQKHNEKPNKKVKTML